MPSAITAGILDGKRNIPQIYTDNVGSDPVKKNAIINSSREITKLINNDEIIPGITSGKVINLNVAHLVSPKSIEDSSKLLSNDLNAPFNIAIEKGTQIRTCPKIIVQIDKLKPKTLIRTTIKETATIISGRTSGTIIKPIIGPLPGNENLVAAREANIPKTVARTEVMIAIFKLVQTAVCKASILANS